MSAIPPVVDVRLCDACAPLMARIVAGAALGPVAAALRRCPTCRRHGTVVALLGMKEREWKQREPGRWPWKQQL